MTSNFWSYIFFILVGALGLDVLIGVHEIGHYIVAKLCKIKVESVSFGFGPTLFKWSRKNTVFKICLVPFGGATKLAGRKDLLKALYNNDKRVIDCEEGSLYKTKPLKRIVTYLAGPLFNLLFAILCYTVLLIIPTVSRTLPARILLTSDSTGQYYSQVCAAKDAGLVSGDTVTAINGQEVTDYFEMQSLLISAKDDEFAVISTPRGQFNVYPIEQQFGILPFSEYENKVTKGKNLGNALSLAFKECIVDTKNFATSLIKIFSGRNKVSETIGGSLVTSESIGEIATKSFRSSFNTGIRTVLYLMASVSISMGFANMLPITALDGGLILISFVEMFTRKTWSPKVYITLQVLGLVVIFVLIPVIKWFF